MEISEIRETFSKGSVALTKTGIKVLYTKKCDTQSIVGTGKEIATSLVDNCLSVTLECVRGYAAKVSFVEPVTDRKPVLYSPLDITDYDEVDIDVMNEDSEFFDFFINADLTDEEDFVGRVNDYLEYRSNTRELTEDDFRKYQKDWASFSRTITELAKSIGCEYESEDLDWINLYLPIGRKVTLSGRDKFLLKRAIEMSDGFDFEWDTECGWFNIAFYM